MQNKVKLIIFDLDGVLVDAKKIHYDTLNIALEAIDPKYKISTFEHLSLYDGLKTNQKLELLTKFKGLPVESYKQIWDFKQKNTLSLLSNLKSSKQITNCLQSLYNDGYKIACCINNKRINKILLFII